MPRATNLPLTERLLRHVGASAHKAEKHMSWVSAYANGLRHNEPTRPEIMRMLSELDEAEIDLNETRRELVKLAMEKGEGNG